MLMGGGVAFIDFDRDGYEDLYVTGGVAADKLYRNNGDGTFTDITAAAGILGTDTVNTMGVVAGDFNNDGFKELFITTWDGYHNLLFLNNGNGTFQNISSSAGILDTALSISASLGDVFNASVIVYCRCNTLCLVTCSLWLIFNSGFTFRLIIRFQKRPVCDFSQTVFHTDPQLFAQLFHRRHLQSHTHDRIQSLVDRCATPVPATRITTLAA